MCHPVVNLGLTCPLKGKEYVTGNLFYPSSSPYFLQPTTKMFTLEGLHFLLMH